MLSKLFELEKLGNSFSNLFKINDRSEIFNWQQIWNRNNLVIFQILQRIERKLGEEKSRLILRDSLMWDETLFSYFGRQRGKTFVEKLKTRAECLKYSFQSW